MQPYAMDGRSSIPTCIISPALTVAVPDSASHGPCVQYSRQYLVNGG